MVFVVTALVLGERSRSGRLRSNRAVSRWLSEVAQRTGTTWRSVDGMFEGLFLNEHGQEKGTWHLTTPSPEPRAVHF